MKIYIAGPFTTNSNGDFHNNARTREDNLQMAKKIGILLARMGHEPYVPHTHIGPCDEEISYDELMRINLSFLKHWADAFFFIGPSRGANIEKEEAEKLGLPIFKTVEDVPKDQELEVFSDTNSL